MKKSADFQDFSKYTPEGEVEIKNVCQELDEIFEQLGTKSLRKLHSLMNNYEHEVWRALHGVSSELTPEEAEQQTTLYMQ